MGYLNKYFFVSILSISLSTYIIGQTPNDINIIDGNNKKQGTWIKYYPNGNIQYKGTFRDNHPVDTITRYYENSIKMSIMVYSDNGGDVYAYIYHPNGFPASEGNYTNQMKEGTWKFYSSAKDGYLITEENYSENIRNGLSVKYFENGNIAEKINFIYGIKDGEWLRYYSDGTLFIKASYLNGMLDGKFETWFNNGNPEYSGMYKDNLKEGKWLIYNEDGSLKYEANYVRGTTDNRQMIIDASESIDKMEQGGKYVDDPEDGLPMFY